MCHVESTGLWLPLGSWVEAALSQAHMVWAAPHSRQCTSSLPNCLLGHCATQEGKSCWHSHTLTFSSRSLCFSTASSSVRPTHSASSSGMTNSWQADKEHVVRPGGQSLGPMRSRSPGLNPHLILVIDGCPPLRVVWVQLGVPSGKAQQHPSLQVHPKLGAQVLLRGLAGSYEWGQVLLAGSHPPGYSQAAGSPQARTEEGRAKNGKRGGCVHLGPGEQQSRPQQQAFLWAESPHGGCPPKGAWSHSHLIGDPPLQGPACPSGCCDLASPL